MVRKEVIEHVVRACVQHVDGSYTGDCAVAFDCGSTSPFMGSVCRELMATYRLYQWWGSSAMSRPAMIDNPVTNLNFDVLGLGGQLRQLDDRP